MPLLNYTTTVSADKSIATIQKALAKAGASAILHELDDNGNIMALSFRIKMPSPDAGSEVHDISFRLPTDWRAVQRRLQTQRVEPRYRTQEHALRVAWRITKDWVEAQLAIIESQMVTTAQVFLPYAVTSNGQTLQVSNYFRTRTKAKAVPYLVQTGLPYIQVIEPLNLPSSAEPDTARQHSASR